jgi:hypothetical protein
MNWNKGIRQVHRWLSMAFTLAVVSYSVMMLLGWAVPIWMNGVVLLPLFLLLLTGLYLFVLPYTVRRRGGA